MEEVKSAIRPFKVSGHYKHSLKDGTEYYRVTLQSEFKTAGSTNTDAVFNVGSVFPNLRADLCTYEDGRESLLPGRSESQPTAEAVDVSAAGNSGHAARELHAIGDDDEVIAVMALSDPQYALYVQECVAALRRTERDVRSASMLAASPF